METPRKPHSNRVSARTVVITGASSGFGRGVALRLAGEGWRMVLVARRGSLVEELAARCPSALAIQADIGEPGVAEAIGDAARKYFGGFEAWINNAGVAAIGRYEDIPVADHLRVAQTNLLGTLAGSHAALVQFRKQGHGTLVNVASLLGRVPVPYYASYVASKTAIVGLDAALRQELRAAGATDIHVCTVLPGAADTTFFEHAGNYTGHRLDPVPLDAPEPVIEAIAGALDTPRDEIVVGTGTSTAIWAEQLAPALTEMANALMTSATQFDHAHDAPPTSGNLHAPVEAGRGVHGSLREAARHARH
jgi:short-subunit dehydrogenase